MESKREVRESAGLISGIIFVFAPRDRQESITGKDMKPGPSEIERLLSTRPRLSVQRLLYGALFCRI
jgi:hypothetical protein